MTNATNAALETILADPRYRVLTRFEAMPTITLSELPVSAGLAAVIDTETTGVTADDSVIELGLVLFAYDRQTARVLGTLASYCGLRDPGRPIPPEAQAVHGITDAMVAGQSLDLDYVEELLQSAEFIVAHNAAFDRVMCEKLSDLFKGTPWVCSLRQVPWEDFGISSGKLEFIAYKLGFFYEAHRADADCHAVLNALNCPPPRDAASKGVNALSYLLEAVERNTKLVYALASPFDLKSDLSARGYRWSDGATPGTEKAWWIEVPAENLADELGWLKKAIYRGRPAAVSVGDVTPLVRFSNRKLGLTRVIL